MRPAMAMIELIFAIVIIAISVMTIPSMMAVADKASKGIAIDEDIMSRLSGWTIDKFQARWDGNYSASGSGPLNIVSMDDLNCSRSGGYRIGSDENVSSMQCNMATWDDAIPSSGSGVLANGIEQLNGGSEPITITPIGDGTSYNVTATYSVAYVDSTVTPLTGSNTQTAIWTLGSSNNMMPDGSLNNPTHLKRVVTRFNDATLGVDTTLTFFKSNKGN
ncbi:MAG: hypothetical protein PHQ22_02530 [Sulfuricurvum sp.]|nr:hypothetical protein [Sulfuricurvum sp.]MDD5386051.1 hypothetical protein [Sulfuricurvum sp.]